MYNSSFFVIASTFPDYLTMTMRLATPKLDSSMTGC